ncbi:CD164 sialomucin-like 2 protein [Sinocyclocheilus rhinocerous]|uniref:CD164 sialomucin-like 2 protein n=1 Tax=Sinocyclocheilus rhinocerous TaxID=307959 RepID=UPI0007B9EA8B|nr:PREDICTED: CD164 sialomucin-like 2 protein [Sinocyclocheilus rhinocerous]
MRCVWAALCGTVLLMQVIITNSQTSDSSIGNCSQFDSCNGCISGDSALNLTRCVWQSCNDGNDTRCMSDTEDSGGCSVYNETGMCQTDGGSADGGGKDTTPGSGPGFSQASFDLSSFIGGIILVLVLQAGAFFAMRFLKTKDSSYETIDQPQ